MYPIVFNNFVSLNKFFIKSNNYMCQYNIKKNLLRQLKIELEKLRDKYKLRYLILSSCF